MGCETGGVTIPPCMPSYKREINFVPRPTVCMVQIVYNLLGKNGGGATVPFCDNIFIPVETIISEFGMEGKESHLYGAIERNSCVQKSS